MCDRNVLFIFEVLCKFWHVLETSWALNIIITLTNQDQSSQESVLCTKCSISYIISRWPVNRVYWETSWFSAIYAGKIAFFTFGHFVGSNFEKPRTSQESVLCTKCSILYIISHRPPGGFTERLLDFQSFMQVKLHFLHLDASWVLTLKKPRTRQESVLCTKCSISYIISHRPVRGVYRETSSFSVIYAGKIAFFTFGNFVGSQVKSPFYVRNAAFRTQFPADPWTGSTERLLGFQPFMQEKMKFWADLEIRGF